LNEPFEPTEDLIVPNEEILEEHEEPEEYVTQVYLLFLTKRQMLL
jgi:hypothetical protein